jgi:hypothetical protein
MCYLSHSPTQSCAHPYLLVLSTLTHIHRHTLTQEQFETISKEELAQLDKDVMALRAQVSTEKEAVATLGGKCRSLHASLSNEALATELVRVRAENESMRAKVHELSKTSRVVSEKERQQMNKRLAFALSKWKERKRLTMLIADTLLDNAAERLKMKRPELLEDAGVETDEEMGVSMQAVLTTSS